MPAGPWVMMSCVPLRVLMFTQAAMVMTPEKFSAAGLPMVAHWLPPKLRLPGSGNCSLGTAVDGCGSRTPWAVKLLPDASVKEAAGAASSSFQ